tara:strand:- start:202 stop:690 length:489 start_codon:yes stop_codon:yes gene_type:complete
MSIIKPNNNTISAITALPAAITTGKVLQVITATDQTDRTTTSTSFVTASNTLSVAITPSATSSKMYIQLNSTCHINTTNYARYYTIYRDSTNLGNGDQGMTALYAENNADPVVALNMGFLDSPNTTSQITYQPYFRTGSSGQAAWLTWDQTKSSMTVFEIAG